MKAERLDQTLVTLGLAASRARAQALIKAGVVLVDGTVATKSSTKVSSDVKITVTENPNPWVSRAALKLVHALEVFDLSPEGAVALDVGASTGGFTEVLLENGAKHVFALDVGHGQLHESLRDDLRVTNLENTNARNISDEMLPPLDWIVTDVSFISLEKALPVPLSFARQGAFLVALVKPQFEVGRENIGKGGIVKDTEAQETIRKRIEMFLADEGWNVTGRATSPIKGGDGNVEFLVTAIKA